jgi:hypothetical protein
MPSAPKPMTEADVLDRAMRNESLRRQIRGSLAAMERGEEPKPWEELQARARQQRAANYV